MVDHMKNDSEAPMTPCNQYGVLGQRQSSLVTKTVREAPAEEDSINASLLLRAGFIRKHMAGTYSFLPLGMRVLMKIEQIIREEMNAIGGRAVRKF